MKWLMWSRYCTKLGQVQEVIGAEYEYKDLSATYFSEVKNTDEQRI